MYTSLFHIFKLSLARAFMICVLERYRCHGLLDQYDYMYCIAFHFFDKIRYQFQKVTDKCFRKCVTSPGTSLGSSDQVCSAFQFYTKLQKSYI